LPIPVVKGARKRCKAADCGVVVILLHRCITEYNNV
jgi:hypothetical protein